MVHYYQNHYGSIIRNTMEEFMNIYDNFNKDIIINKHHYDCIKSKISINESYKDLLYMITVKYYNSYSYNNQYNSLSYHKDKFLEAHKNICHQILVGNVSRQKYKQPFCLVYGDAAGTRSGRYTSEDHIGNGFHHHGLMLIHPDTNDAFKSLTPEDLNQISRNTDGVASIDIRPIDDRKPLPHVINYSAKMESQYRNNAQYGDLLCFMAPDFKDGEISKVVMNG